ncbi:YaiI/YqxD family protein [Staphylococcus sp. IVB6181]|uniref:YaiI/YqxD family protein n=1 Tax=Staphylococcus sp. IVB6181 TaxID=2929481 RepID=UPI0021D2DA4A|nr:YaiI/YqxD family protein [Staphylococcus sp. IVB6181]UXV34657.1 YaiI/YqxD family protein [Staphylococcus sp. IVB6181]
MTQVIIDGDACPVTGSIIQLTEGTGIFVVLVRSYSHFSMRDYPEHVKVSYVDDGPDQVDYKIVQLAQPDDIVVTQDYGLASLLIGKIQYVLHHNGMLYSDKNMAQLLEQRYLNAQTRHQGTRHKGLKKFSDEARAKFEQSFQRVIAQISS